MPATVWAAVDGAKNGASAAVTPATPQTSGTKGKFTNTGRELIRVYNGSGAGVTVTVEGNGETTYRGRPWADFAQVVAAGETRYLGPFEPSAFNKTVDSVEQQVQWYVSAATSVTAEVFRPNS